MANQNSFEASKSQDGYSGPAALLTAVRSLLSWTFIFWVLLFGFVAEVGLRVMTPQYANQIYTADLTGGHPVSWDRGGFRSEPEAPVQKAQTQIIALGDSTTFGTGVAASMTWSAQLSKQLGETVAVHNAGKPGAGLRDLANILKTNNASAGAPDIVLLLVSSNMVSFTDFRWEETPYTLPQHPAPAAASPVGLQEQAKRLVQSSALLKVLTTHIDFLKFGLGLSNHRIDNVGRPLSPLMAYGWVQPDVPTDTQTRLWPRFEAAFSALSAEIRQNNQCLVLGFLPPRFMIGDRFSDNLKFVPKGRFQNDARDTIKHLAQTFDWPFVDGGEALRRVRQREGALGAPLFVPADYTHLDRQGHQTIAQEFTHTLTPVLDETRSCVFH